MADNPKDVAAFWRQRQEEMNRMRDEQNPNSSAVNFIQKLMNGNIYDYSKSPQENEASGAALSPAITTPGLVNPQTIAQKEAMMNLPPVPLKNDFSSDQVKELPIQQNLSVRNIAPKQTLKDSDIVPVPEMTQQEAAKPAEPQAPEKTLAERLNELVGTNRNFNDSELTDAQANREDMLRKLLMLDAANSIGQAVFGGKADPNLLKGYRDLANLGVSDVQDRRKSAKELEEQDRARRTQAMAEMNTESDLKYKDLNQKKMIFELGDKEKENDPNSDVSKAFREYMKSYVKMSGVPIKIDDRMSMADLQKTSGMLGNVVSAKMAQDAKKELAIEAAKIKAENSKNASSERIGKFANQMNEQMKDIIKVKENANSLRTALQDAIRDPSGIRDISAVYKFIKALDSDSAVREGEIGLLQNAIPAFDNLKNMVEGQFKGDVSKLSPKARENMLEIANEYMKAADNSYERKLKTKRAIGNALDIPEEFYNPYYTPGSKQNNTSSSGKQVVKKQYSKSANKTKLIYSDGTEEIVDGQQ